MQYDPGGVNGLIGAVAGAVGTAVTGALWMRRKLSRDNAEIKRDDAEGHLISRLQGERDAAVTRADVADARATALESQVAYLAAENRQLLRQMAELSRELTKRTSLLPDRIRKIVDTNFAPLDQLPPEPREGWKAKP